MTSKSYTHSIELHYALLTGCDNLFNVYAHLFGNLSNPLNSF